MRIFVAVLDLRVGRTGLDLNDIGAGGVRDSARQSQDKTNYRDTNHQSAPRPAVPFRNLYVLGQLDNTHRKNLQISFYTTAINDNKVGTEIAGCRRKVRWLALIPTLQLSLHFTYCCA